MSARVGRWAVIAAASLVVMLPAIFFEQFVRQDALHNIRWQRVYAPQMWSGDVPVRWLTEGNYGFGSPAFFIYPPLGQFVAALAHPVLPGDGHVYDRLVFSATIALALGGFGVWAWIRTITDRKAAALLAALVYILLPYHAYVDTYQRGALAELWALGVAPWCFFGVRRLSAGDWRGPLILALGAAGVILSNMPSAVMILPLVMAYGLYEAAAVQRIWLLVRAAGSVALGGLLSGAYLATALTQLSFINSARLFDGRQAPENWMLLGPPWPDPAIHGSIVVVLAVHLALTALLGALALRNDVRGSRFLGAAMIAVVLGTSFALTSWSAPIWALETPLRKVQFPWRLLTLQTLAIAALASLALPAEAGRRTRVVTAGLWTILPLLLAFNTVMLTRKIEREEQVGSGRTITELVQRRDDAAEYQLGDLADLQERFGDARLLITSGRGDVRILNWRPRNLELSSIASGPISVTLRQFAYTGWRYRIDAGAWREATRDGPLAALLLPSGRHRIEVRLEVTRAETLGWFASAIGLLGIAFWAVGARFAAIRRTRPA